MKQQHDESEKMPPELSRMAALYFAVLLESANLTAYAVSAARSGGRATLSIDVLKARAEQLRQYIETGK